MARNLPLFKRQKNFVILRSAFCAPKDDKLCLLLNVHRLLTAGILYSSSSRSIPNLRRKNESIKVSGRTRRPKAAHFANGVTV